jgi:hypothetical protein
VFTPSTHLDFGLTKFRLPSGFALNRALYGQRSAIYCSSRRLLNSLSSSKFYLLLYTSSTLPFLPPHTFHCRTARSGGSRSDVPGEMTADVFAGRRSTYLQCGFFAVSPNTRRVQCSRAQKYRYSLTTLKFLSPKPTLCPVAKIILFCLFFADLQSHFCCFCLQC